jgi:hypothetical protein
MKYDNGKGLIFHFDADYDQPDSSTGAKGGWMFSIHSVEAYSEKDDKYHLVTDADAVNAFIETLSDLDYNNMEAITEKENQLCTE